MFMSMKKPICKPAPDEQAILEALCVRPLTQDERSQAQALLGEQHYLGRVQPVGERIFYVAEALGRWRALFSWNAAAKHLRHRDAWIGWTPAQRRRRLTLAAHNSRFLILPGASCPNLASRALRLCLARLAADWPTHEKNNGRDERRPSATCEVTAEAVGFPAAAPAAD